MKFFTLLISLALPQTSFAGANSYDYIYKNRASEFYNSLSEEEFLEHKHRAYEEVIWNALTPLLSGTAIYLGYRYWPTQNAPSQQNLKAFGGFTFFISTLLSGLIQNTLSPYTFELQEPISGFVNSLRNYIAGAPHDEVQELELRYIKIKQQLTLRTQTAVESRFEKLRTNFNPQRLGVSNSKEDPELRIVKQILSLPVNSKPLEFDNNLFLREFSAYVNMTSTNPIEELERFCKSLSIASKHENPKLKSPLYLQGPPGVGKTEAAFKLGKVLDVPVIKINLAEFSNIGQIKGIRCEFSEDNRCMPGLIASKIISNFRSGYLYKNALLFFDEADQVLNRIHEGQSHELVSFMLDLLEGKTQFIDNPYFETELDIRHFGIILAGNSILSNKALQSRLSTLEFGNYTLEYRVKAGRERFLPEIIKDYPEILQLEDFTATDYEAIDAIAHGEHQKLLNQDEDPGFREQIRQIERLVHQKTQRLPLTTTRAIGFSEIEGH